MHMIRLTAVFLIATLSAASAADYTWVPEEKLEGLEESDATRLDELLVRPGTDFSGYKHVYIAPVEFPLSKKVSLNQPRVTELGKGDKKALERSLRNAFGDRFDETVTVVDEPGEETLTIAFGITEVLPNRDIIGTVVTRNIRDSASNRRSVGIGKATVEAILSDATSGEVVAVAFDSFSGNNLSTNLNANTRWGDVRDAFRRWAREVRKLFAD